MKTIVTDRKLRRLRKIRSQIKGVAAKPRISVFRSNKYIYAQAFDDDARTTLAEFSSLKIAKAKEYKKVKKLDEAKKTGIELAKLLLAKKITFGVFDRGVYSYKGRVKALAEGLREGGLKI